MQALEEQVRDFPEQLRRERAAVGAQVEELHTRAVSAFADKSVDLEKRLQQESRRAELAESELKVVRDHCRSLDGQLKSSSDSVFTLQSQLSKSDSEWRLEFDAIQQQLQQQGLQAATFSKELQAQTTRADEATAMLREAEADVRLCRHAMQLDADRLQVLFLLALCACVHCCIFSCKHHAVQLVVCMRVLIAHEGLFCAGA